MISRINLSCTFLHSNWTNYVIAHGAMIKGSSRLSLARLLLLRLTGCWRKLTTPQTGGEGHATQSVCEYTQKVPRASTIGTNPIARSRRKTMKLKKEKCASELQPVLPWAVIISFWQACAFVQQVLATQACGIKLAFFHESAPVSTLDSWGPNRPKQHTLSAVSWWH